jgi:hypothetical protein
VAGGLRRALDVHAVASGVVQLGQLHEIKHLHVCSKFSDLSAGARGGAILHVRAGMAMSAYLVAAPTADDRRRELFGDAPHSKPHLHREPDAR